MIGADVLVFPESGPEFLRALKMAVLYADRAHALTLEFPFPGMAKALSDALPATAANKKLLQHLRFLDGAHETLALLVRERVLVLPGEILQESLSSFARELTVSPQTALLTEEHFEGGDRLKRFGRCCPLNFIEWLYQLSLWTFGLAAGLKRLNIATPFDAPDVVEHAHKFNALVDAVPEWARPLAYLTMLMVVAEHRGIVPVSWSPVFSDSLRAVRLAFSECLPGDVLSTRHTVQARLAQVVLARHLPAVDDLPFEEVLEIRRQRHAELEAFRAAIRTLSASVDPTEPSDTLALDLDDIVATQVDPALRDLQNAMYSNRLEALKTISKSWESLAKALVPFSVAHAASAPLDIQAVAAVVGGLAAMGPLIAAEIERHRLVHCSQWSLIFHLRKAQRLREAEERARNDPFSTGP
jgi:hypothetical protein